VAMNEALGRPATVKEPRYLARVALARALQGRLREAAVVQADIKWYGKTKAEPDPLVALLNGAMALAGGTPEAALEALARLEGTRAQLLRAQALIDLGKYKDALLELDAAAQAAPDSIEVKIWRDMARTLTSSGKARDEAAAELERTSRKAKTKVGRHAHGAAMLLTGNLQEARRRLEQALEGISDDEPNPLAYRTHVALAAVEQAEGKQDAAATQLGAALAINSGYSPARIALARIAVAAGDGEQAVGLLEPVVGEPELATAAVKLLWAEALARRPTAGKKDKERDAMKAQAVAALEAAKVAGAAPEELARVAALIDPALAASMAPAPAVEAPRPAPPTKKRKRRGGRGR
jgi:tetratricopeptide (TPR) repeat protein